MMSDVVERIDARMKRCKGTRQIESWRLFRDIRAELTALRARNEELRGALIGLLGNTDPPRSLQGMAPRCHSIYMPSNEACMAAFAALSRDGGE